MGWNATSVSSIYAVRCKANGKVYIGRSCQPEVRMMHHIYEMRNGNKTVRDYNAKTRIKSPMQLDFDAFGEEAFEFYVLEKDVPPELCKDREAYWIAEYRSTDHRYGYNSRTEQETQKAMATDGLPPNKYRMEQEGQG